MISANSDLITLLNTSSTFMVADLYTITTRQGVTLRYTSADTDLVIDGHTYDSSLPIERGSTKIVAGLEVDEFQMTLYPGPANLIGSQTILAAVGKGALDGANFSLYRAFFSPDWQTYVGSIWRFSGRISDITDYSRTEIPISVKSDLELLNVKMPRNIYQPGCRRTLFDAGCGVDKESWAYSSTALDGSTQSRVLCGLSQSAGASGTLSALSFGTGDGISIDDADPTGTTAFSVTIANYPDQVTAVYVNGVLQETSKYYYATSGNTITITFKIAPWSGDIITADVTYSQAGFFDLGTIIWTSGANLGVTRTVKSYSPGAIDLSLPLPYPVVAGDTFTAYAGCDRTKATCSAKFNNLINFSGEPYIPAAETAY